MIESGMENKGEQKSVAVLSEQDEGIEIFGHWVRIKTKPKPPSVPLTFLPAEELCGLSETERMEKKKRKRGAYILLFGVCIGDPPVRSCLYPNKRRKTEE